MDRIYVRSNKEALRKTVNYYYDGNGNELGNTASWTHPHDVRLRQSTKGSVYSDNMADGVDPLIDRTNNTFDGFGRLVKVERVSSGARSVTAFLYNGDDLRVSKTVKKSNDGYREEVTNYLYDRQNVILETDGRGKARTRYVKGVNYIASMSAGSITSYFLFNGHGDVVQTVDEAGEVQNSYDYDIWGNPTLTVETVECPIRFAGEFYDAETGLYYLRARYYNPYIGRFLSEDSYWGEDTSPLSLNRYTYAHNDPIQYVDPTGHAVIKKGAEGDRVVAIQEMLQELGYNTGKADGKFGSKTEAAIKQFQKDYGLQVDGKVGNQSLTALKTMTNVKSAPDSVKALAKASISNAKTGDIKDDTILMSIKTFDEAMDNVAKVRKATGGGSVQTEIKNNTVVMTGTTVKGGNSTSAGVKVSPGKEISATSGSGVAKFISTVSDVAGKLQKLAELSKGSGSTNSSNTGTKLVSIKTVAPTAPPTPVPAPTPPANYSNQAVMTPSNNSYASKTINNIVLGNWTDDVTLAGTAAQVATGVLGIDLPADIRDIAADFVNWENTPGHYLQTGLDLIGLIPVVGAAKYADEAGTLIKNSDEAAEAVGSYADEVVEGASKYADDVAEGAVKNFGPMNKGPLPDKVANTFRSGTYSEIVTQGDTILYRSYGGNAGELGSYWTTTKPQGPLQSVIDNALDQNWGNTATDVSTIKVPKGTTIYQGYAALQGSLVGGGVQVYIPEVNSSWIIK